ncbi:MAG: hypothetical protein ACP5LA_03230 [Thermoplasmata archaeon]
MAKIPQIELILNSSTEKNLPVMIRIILGSIKDVETLRTIIEDLGIDKITFVFDRGIFQRKISKKCIERK